MICLLALLMHDPSAVLMPCIWAIDFRNAHNDIWRIHLSMVKLLPSVLLWFWPVIWPRYLHL